MLGWYLDTERSLKTKGRLVRGSEVREQGRARFSVNVGVYRLWIGWLWSLSGSYSSTQALLNLLLSYFWLFAFFIFMFFTQSGVCVCLAPEGF